MQPNNFDRFRNGFVPLPERLDELMRLTQRSGVFCTVLLSSFPSLKVVEAARTFHDVQAYPERLDIEEPAISKAWAQHPEHVAHILAYLSQPKELTVDFLKQNASSTDLILKELWRLGAGNPHRALVNNSLYAFKSLERLDESALRLLRILLQACLDANYYDILLSVGAMKGEVLREIARFMSERDPELQKSLNEWNAGSLRYVRLTPLFGQILVPMIAEGERYKRTDRNFLECTLSEQDTLLSRSFTLEEMQDARFIFKGLRLYQLNPKPWTILLSQALLRAPTEMHFEAFCRLTTDPDCLALLRLQKYDYWKPYFNSKEIGDYEKYLTAILGIDNSLQMEEGLKVLF